MFRGFATNAGQEDTLAEAGVKRSAVYRELKPAIFSLRHGDILVVDGLQWLGETREEISKAVDSVHAKGCTVLDADTKLSTAKNPEKLIDAAMRAKANARRGPGKKKKHLPWDKIARIWFRKPPPTNAVVMLEINHGRRGKDRLSYATVYRKLGKRDALPGRPSKAT